MRFLAVIGLFALSLGSQANAAGTAAWTCDNGSDIEAAGIRAFHGRLSGFLSWDCFPGDGICSSNAVVTESRDRAGDLVFAGNGFTLRISGTPGRARGTYRATLTARDQVDPQTMGRGFVFNGAVECSLSSP